MQQGAGDIVLQPGDVVAQAVDRDRVERVAQHPRVHRAQRAQPHRAALEVAGLVGHALQQQLHLGLALAAQAAQLEQLLGALPALVLQALQQAQLQRPERIGDSAAQQLDAPGQQVAREHVLEGRQAALEQAQALALDARGQRLARRQRVDLLGRQAQRAGGAGALALDLLGDLLPAQQRVGQGVDLVEHRVALHRLRAEVVAPDRQVRAGDAGVGADDEDQRVRRRQQRERQRRLGADGVEPGGVEHDDAALEQRVRVVDDRMPPARHLDQALGDQWRVVVGALVVPEAQRARLFDADGLGAHDLAEVIGQALRGARVEPDARPQLAAPAQLVERLRQRARVDRQQREHRRLAAVPADLDRAHGFAPRRGRQHAATAVGEEDGVDQLGLAARKLGDEGHHQAVAGELAAQVLDDVGGVGIEQALGLEGLRDLGQPTLEQAAPAGIGIDLSGKRALHAGTGARRASRAARAL